MKPGDVKLFKDKEKLYAMVNLRRNGWALTSLSLLYGCQVPSIWDQCDKYGVIPLTDEVYTAERITTKVLVELLPDEPRWRVIDGQRVNRGRTYKDYLNRSVAAPSLA